MGVDQLIQESVHMAIAPYLEKFEKLVLEHHEETLTMDQAARFLQVSRSSMYVLKKKIPHKDEEGIGVRFLKSNLILFMKANNRLTLDQIEQKAQEHIQHLNKKRKLKQERKNGKANN